MTQTNKDQVEKIVAGWEREFTNSQVGGFLKRTSRVVTNVVEIGVFVLIFGFCCLVVFSGNPEVMKVVIPVMIILVAILVYRIVEEVKK